MAYGIATDNLRLGHLVIADCVNAAQAARDAWAIVATACQVACLQVHLSCSDADEHCRRLSLRRADIEGHVLPDWAQVSAMRCDVPTGAMTIDTSACDADGAVELILERLR